MQESRLCLEHVRMAAISLRTVESVVEQQPYDIELAQRLEDAQFALSSLLAYILADAEERLKLERQADVTEGKREKKNRLRLVAGQ